MGSHLVLNIRPQAWQRVKIGRGGHSYVPKETRQFKEAVALLAKTQFHTEPYKTPVRIHVVYFLEKPKRPKFKTPGVRPDLDNYDKALRDGLTGVLWEDDSLIVCAFSEKKYITADEQPRIELYIEAEA